MQPVTNPELPEIARALPADTAYQIIRTAKRLGFTGYSDVLAEVANAVATGLIGIEPTSALNGACLRVDAVDIGSWARGHWSALSPASRRAALYGLLVRMARPRGASGVSITASSALNP